MQNNYNHLKEQSGCSLMCNNGKCVKDWDDTELCECDSGFKFDPVGKNCINNVGPACNLGML